VKTGIFNVRKKSTKIIIVILVLFGVLKITGGLVYFSVPTTSNEPNLKIESHFVGSSFVKPKKLDFAYFKVTDSMFGEMTVVKRLIALPKDTLQCINSEIFVNGKNIDIGLNLRRTYSMSVEQYQEIIPEFIKKDDSYLKFFITNDSMIVSLDEDFVNSLSIELIMTSKFNSESISKDIKSKTENWTMNNFGPIILSDKKYFFVGDNRDNSMDSRYRGFVDEEHIKGTLLFQF